MQLVSQAGYVPTSFRTLPPFDVVRAATTAEAVDALAGVEGAEVLAGGTDFPARFNEGRTPARLVDIGRVGALRDIRVEDGTLVIGAAVTHAAGVAHPLVGRVPGLAEAWSRLANPRIRLSATIGGNLASGRPRYEAAIFLAALDARLRVASTAGTSDMPVGALAAGGLPKAALLTAILVPLGARLDYDRSLRPLLTQAVAMGEDGALRVAVATERVPVRVLMPVPGAAAAAAYADLAFGDPVSGEAWLRRAAGALLARQIARLAS